VLLSERLLHVLELKAWTPSSQISKQIITRTTVCAHISYCKA
jgi:hypothetical protein